MLDIATDGIRGVWVAHGRNGRPHGAVADHMEKDAGVDIIEVDRLVKRYGSFIAVDGVSFTVREGELFGFLGPNGAGKSTTISVLCTLLRPTEGRVLVNGYDVASDPDGVRRSIGIIFQDPSLDTQLTAMENLAFHARVYHLPRSYWNAEAERLLRLVDLWERRDDLVKNFSGGMKRRLEIARGLLHRPRVLFLDEPTLGLDPQTRDHIWTYLEQIRRDTGTTLFLTTHYMEEAERCDRIAIIDHGHIVALDTPDALKGMVGGDIITLTTGDDDRAAAVLQERFGLRAAQVDSTLRLEVQNGEAMIPRIIQGIDVPIRTVSLRRPSLEDVFLKITGREMRQEEVSEVDRMREHVRAGRG